MRRICIIRQGFYPWDPRLQREVRALLVAGHRVDVLCLRGEGERRLERDGGLTVFRLPPAHRRGSVIRYLYEYAAFFVTVFLLVSVLQVVRRYRVVQVCTIPDALVFASLVPRLLGAKIVLDLYEAMPEFLASRFKTGLEHPAVRLLGRLERRSIAFAALAVTCTEQMRQAFIGRGAPPDKIAVVMNAANEAVFAAERVGTATRDADDGEFVLISHGTLEERYGLDTIIRAVALLRHDLPDLRLRVYGNGAYRSELLRLTADLQLERQVWFSDGFVPIAELVEAIASADAGVVAIKRDPFRDLSHCNKMFDFIAMRKPAIVSRTVSVEAYFDDDCFELFASDDAPELARAIRRLHDDPARRQALVEHVSRVSEPYRWVHQERSYRSLIEGLLRGPTQLEAGTERRAA
ncbi:MAG TPA: glycosyltransferase [Thermomicrobiaceae bacterium]|nr:glycosyltransferase [Thermomicrobiaceae bacterium]